MKKILISIFTIMLFLFSYLYSKEAVNFLRYNDPLMQEIKDKQKTYNTKPINAIITNHFIIPGINGKSINLKKNFQKMKKINNFNESLLVYDIIYPDISINKHYDKIILSGNKKYNKISIILDIQNDVTLNKINSILKKNSIYLDLLSNNSQNSNFKNHLSLTYHSNINYCLTYNSSIDKQCINNKKYTILGHFINNYFLSQTKNLLDNGIVLVYRFNNQNYYDLTIILNYILNNNYQIVTIDELIKE